MKVLLLALPAPKLQGKPHLPEFGARLRTLLVEHMPGQTGISMRASRLSFGFARKVVQSALVGPQETELRQTPWLDGGELLPAQRWQGFRRAIAPANGPEPVAVMATRQTVNTVLASIEAGSPSEALRPIAQAPSVLLDVQWSGDDVRVAMLEEVVWRPS